jgi:hypothetical protein
MTFEHILIVQQATRQTSSEAMAHSADETVRTLVLGLRLLAIRPQALGQELDDFELVVTDDVVAIDADGLQFKRTLTRGSFVLQDHVAIRADGLVLTQTIKAPASMLGSYKKLSIEVPSLGVVILRARYQSSPQSDQGALNANETHALESAYVAADQDFLTQLGKLHEHGMLESLLQLHSPGLISKVFGR